MFGLRFSDVLILNYNYCPERRGFRFVVPLNAFRAQGIAVAATWTVWNSNPGSDKRVCLYQKRPHRNLFNGCPGSFLWVKLPRREDNKSPPPGLKMIGNISLFHLYAFIAWTGK